MFVDKAGEHIADIMSMNRHLSQISSASAILDTSNYTFHAISFGKDSAGFSQHAHTVTSASGTKSIRVVSYESNSISGYHTSATAQALEYTYKLYPQSPTPMDIRLERNSLPQYSTSVSNVGHCLNTIISPALSANAHLIGCFPASGGTSYGVYDSNNSLIFSGSLSSYYNRHGLMDSSGFLTFAPYSLDLQQIGYEFNIFNQGVIRSAESGFPNEVDLKILLTSGDAGSLLLFGGVYHLGLWTLDIKEMVNNGIYPPYSWNALNNNRKYRLFAKKTFNKDILQIDTNLVSPGVGSFKTIFESGTYSNTLGTIIKWKIKFV